MMRTKQRRWIQLSFMAIWMAAAGPIEAEDAPAAPPAPPVRSAETARDQSPPPAENMPADPAKPVAKPSSRDKKAPRARKPFRPSEEIHVDKAVDFPADI